MLAFGTPPALVPVMQANDGITLELAARNAWNHAAKMARKFGRQSKAHKAALEVAQNASQAHSNALAAVNA